MPFKERFKNRLILFADLTKHPSCGLVDQVFLVLTELPTDRQLLTKVAVANEVLRRDDGNSARKKGHSTSQ
jgi:hypothetical protein